MQKAMFTNAQDKSIILDNTEPFLLTKIGGTGSPEVDMQISKAPYQDGSIVDEVLLKERIVPINGIVFGSSASDLFSKRQYLCSIFNPKLKKGQLKYRNDNGEKAINCYPEQSPVFGQIYGGIAQEFLISLFCPIPFWLDTFITGEEITSWIGGVSFPFSFPVSFATKGETKRNIINSGDVETPIEVTFRGPASNPKITNLITGKYIRVKRSLTANDTLVISTEFGNKKVEILGKDGSKTDAFNYIDLNSTFFKLQVGDNVLEYTSDNGVDPASVYIKYRNRYVGV